MSRYEEAQLGPKVRNDKLEQDGIEMRTQCHVLLEEIEDDGPLSISGNEDDPSDEGGEDLTEPLVTSAEDRGGIIKLDQNEIRSRKRAMGDDEAINDSQRASPNHFYLIRRKSLYQCCSNAVEVQKNLLRNTIAMMNFLAKILFWISLVALTVGVVWYSRELALHGTDPHLIAWFSAGAFVILGFPISIYGILGHLTNYYQPNVQCYVVRILWMVPIYSIESWLCLRFHEVAIYIETLRDCYESFVLYCFLQYLIEVLGGEDALVMMLKDKSPTRGVHYAPLNWCMKPWIMGQPTSRQGNDGTTRGRIAIQWTSPFFVNCKFGCLQYVLLKFLCAIFVMVLERNGLYKEGDFTTKGGYLYICILTNTSQCWALYCLIFFYYATKNELGPIRPVGKFLSVKALVFFTWWQSLGISILFQMGLIPQYQDGEWSAEDVAKGLQAYLICIEMFVGAIVHVFVFPHTDYMKPLSMGRTGEGFRGGRKHTRRRVGRSLISSRIDDRSVCSKRSDAPHSNVDDLESRGGGMFRNEADSHNITKSRDSGRNYDHREVGCDRSSDGKALERTGFVSALIDSTVPRDVMDSTVGVARGDFTVERKTLLYHAAASDEYSLFAKRRNLAQPKNDKTVSKKI